MSRVTLLGVTAITFASMSVLMWLTIMQFNYAVDRWRPEERGQLQCEYKSFQITNTIPPWNVDLYGNTIDAGLPDCPPSRVLKEFKQFAPNVSCEENLNLLETTNQCNLTDLTDWLKSTLFKPFNCSVNSDCTQLIPFYSNRVQIYIFESILILEGLAMLCLVACVINILRNKHSAEKMALIHPPIESYPINP